MYSMRSRCYGIQVKLFHEDVNTHKKHEPTEGFPEFGPVRYPAKPVADENTYNGQSRHAAQQQPVEVIMGKVAHKTTERLGGNDQQGGAYCLFHR